MTRQLPNARRRPRGAPAVALVAAGLCGASAAGAQDRLTGLRTASAGIFVESYSFGDGLVQGGGVAGLPSAIKSATQFVVPLSIAIPIGDRWSADVATVVTNGEVRFASLVPGVPEATAKLSGLGDIRLRATGRLVGDNLLLTLGANIGTGVRELSGEQVATLGVLAAPALGSVLPAASAGPSATSGLVYAFERGGWSWAAGAGLEVRGKFSPVAALAAGLPTTEFDPGAAVHLSLGTDGFVGDGALSVSLTADVYTQDRLTTGVTVLGGTTIESAATVKLGPTLGVDVQWRAPTTRFREFVLFVSERYRAAFTRDGERVDGTSASYLNAGARAAYPLGRLADLTTSLDLWSHTGLSADNTLVTAKTASAALGVGYARRFGAYTVQPYVRLRAGSIDAGAGSTNVTGGGAGITLSTRF